jgi:hypothetical protein
MNHKKSFILIALVLAIGFFGCSREKTAEGPKQESITKNLVPAKAEVKGTSFVAELSDLQVSMIVNSASKEIVETPRLSAHYKITNTSKDLLEVQGVTVEYLDQSGNPIAFSSGDKITKASLSLNALKPGDVADGSLDVTMPRKAVKELAKINIDVVYIPSPLKRETLSLPEKIE